MKIRNGFVSNSSSSSFTCAVCGDEQSGMDLCLSECEMFECTNGHTFHEECVKADLNSPKVQKAYMLDQLKAAIVSATKELEKTNNSHHEYYKKRLEESTKQLKNLEAGEVDDDELDDMCDDWEFRYNAPEGVCPICTMEKFDDSDIRRYVFKRYEIDTDALKVEIKEKYPTYREFQLSLKD
jgi:hypothetical protein